MWSIISSVFHYHCLDFTMCCRSSETISRMQEHIGSPVYKLVGKTSRKNPPFFKNDANAPQALMSNPKQERDREGERKYNKTYCRKKDFAKNELILKHTLHVEETFKRVDRHFGEFSCSKNGLKCAFQFGGVPLFCMYKSELKINDQLFKTQTQD